MRAPSPGSSGARGQEFRTLLKTVETVPLEDVFTQSTCVRGGLVFVGGDLPGGLQLVADQDGEAGVDHVLRRDGQIRIYPVERLLVGGLPYRDVEDFVDLPTEVISEFEDRIRKSSSLAHATDNAKRGRSKVEPRPLLDSLEKPAGSSSIHALALHGVAYRLVMGDVPKSRPRFPGQTVGTIPIGSADFRTLAALTSRLNEGFQLNFDLAFHVLRPSAPSFTEHVQYVRDVDHRMFVAAREVMGGFVNAFIAFHGLKKKRTRQFADLANNAYRHFERAVLDIATEAKSELLLLMMDDFIQEQRPKLLQEDRWLLLGALMDAFGAMKPAKKCDPESVRERMKKWLHRARRRDRAKKHRATPAT